MFDWGFESEDEQHVTGDGVYLCRGKVKYLPCLLVGSSLHMRKVNCADVAIYINEADSFSLRTATSSCNPCSLDLPVLSLFACEAG